MQMFDAELKRINEEIAEIKNRITCVLPPEEFKKTISDLYDFIQRTKKEKEQWHAEYISLLNNMRDFYRDQIELIRQEQGNK